ncbi:Dyp-type peroxidase [Marinobacterium arenosum]|uniref:Dyp-type peroxidase n=1 Tax=Marinobacterium arenosum TaxID=2862496 RepID=UPI001C9840C3|nr:Dyp-type peroxidase [Marinobacterium arenosum]MBY4679030.1 Dyp-type peroxidase [Marinobacterium arenosum]
MAARIQSGITAEASSDAIFLTFNQTDVDQAVVTVRKVLAGIPALQQRYNDNHPEAGVHIVVAVGSGYWNRLCGDPQPKQLRPFPALEQGLRVAPATPVDLLFHIRSDRHDLNFELAWQIRSQLADAAQLVEEVHGFRYLDSRDMTGFVDGTENPTGEHRAEVAVVGAEDSAFSGGSYIHLQRYVHKLPLWQRQPLKTQEDTIGRTKQDNIEYFSADKPLTAHTKRTSLKDSAGRSIEILRHSMPYGSSTECGLMFASYCRTPDNFEAMLESMVIGDGQGHWDHLLKYTRAVTGQAFFAPAADRLERLG